jgi:uncharacterized membrane protein YidH (DUF202 family)
MWSWCKRLALLAIAVCLAVCTFFMWALWRATDLRPTAAGQSVSLDSLSLQLDILSLTMAAVGIALAAVGLFGYQTLKEAAEARAELAAIDVASKRADEIATAAVAKHFQNMLNAGGLSAPTQGATTQLGNVTEVERKED